MNVSQQGKHSLDVGTSDEKTRDMFRLQFMKFKFLQRFTYPIRHTKEKLILSLSDDKKS
jgi:hypothetical protein